MADNQYTYAVARIRSKELQLISRSDIEQLMNLRSEKECLRYLTDRGWGRTGDENADELVTAEREKTWETIREMVEDMSIFNTFLYANDFHNVKAAIKQVYTDSDFPDLYTPNGTLKPETIYHAVKTHDFSLLPEYMRSSAEEAYQVLLHTGDSQLCDVILDKAALDTIYQKGKDSGNELLARYAELKVASADINIAIRSIRTGKDRTFMERALAPCSSLDIKELIRYTLEGEEQVRNYLLTTVYMDAVPALQSSFSAFERWCDNLIINLIRPQKYNPFSVSPLAAYILARENEIKTVRILLSGKRNELSDEAIRERLREMYV